MKGGLGGGRFHQNAKVCEQGEGGYHISVNVRIYFFLIENLVHKLLTIATRFFVSFIKYLLA